jgi:hypothetical protein
MNKTSENIIGKKLLDEERLGFKITLNFSNILMQIYKKIDHL